MIVVGDNLRGIVRSQSICDESLVEEFSLGLRLDRRVYRIRTDLTGEAAVTYGHPYNAEDLFTSKTIQGGYLTLSPRENVLACSLDNYSMPKGYFGLVQTKGSLARLFVSATCNDGQVEPGYDGRITLELTNHSPCQVHIPIGATIAQLFVLRCTTETHNPYNGRYQNATGPTLANFN